MKLGDWLRENHMTHEDFAAKVDVDHSTISRIIPRPGKKQTRKPSFELVSKIAKATDGQVTANDFVDGDDEDEPVTHCGLSG